MCTKGFIGDITTGHILSPRKTDSTQIECFWEARNEDTSRRDDQQWLRSKDYKYGMFTLQHVESKKFLTDDNSGGFILKGNYR